MKFFRTSLFMMIVMIIMIPFVYAHAQNTVTLENSNSSISGIDPACTDNPDNCYAFFSGFGDLLDQKVATFTEVDSLGSFLNRIIGFGIAVGGVIAVVMIMYTGYQYMSTDNTNTKGEMRSKMVNTVVGFLLLLSIYTILRTINPDLLNLTPGIDIAELDNDEAGDGESDVDASPDQITDPSGIKTKACKSGLTKVQNTVVCKDLASNLEKMITAAKKDNIILQGGGWRSPEKQISLRIKNCGGNTSYNIYEKPSLKCNPPTAKPGTSRHESGLAIDFGCNNLGTINVSRRSGTKVCYDWLKRNAGKYGFYNLPQEDWHWSVDGK